MLLQTALVSPIGSAPDLRLFWTALLLGVIVFGPGPLALDRLLEHDVDSSALPGIGALHRRYGHLRGADRSVLPDGTARLAGACPGLGWARDVRLGG